MKSKKIKLVSILGPTATGKTSLSIKLAKHFNGEIISADSIQAYKEFNILSAKPSKEEMSGVEHYLIDFLSVEKTYSVADFTVSARKIINSISHSGKLPILVGGTGLYIESLIKNINFDSPKFSSPVKITSSGPELMEILLKVDPESAKKIHINNVKRLKRAVEFFYEVGYPISKQVENSKKIESPYHACKIGLTFKNRESLYSKINARVDEMRKKGLLEEVESINKEKNVSKTAIGAIGYKEMLEYVNSNCSLEDAYENIKRNSRRYAKRQLTWFKRDESINWIYIDEYQDFSQVFEKAKEIIKNFYVCE